MDTTHNLPAERKASSTTPSPSQRRTDKWLAGRVRTLLAQFFDSAEADIQAAVTADWLVALGDYPADEVNAACHAYLAFPRRTASGAPARPIPGDIIDRILTRRREEARARPALPPPPTPERERCSPEAAARMLAEAGLSEVIPFRRMGDA